MVADPEADLRVTVGGAAVHPALLVVGAEHLRDELRRPRRGRRPGDEPRRQGGRLRPRHRRGRDVEVPHGGRRRPDLADRHRLLRLPRRQTATSTPRRSPRTRSLPQVKMIEIKVSQGAKPGHGGILPAAKVTEEIAEARLVPAGQGRVLADLPQGVLDPAGDDARSSPSCASCRGGKPVGFKICIGDPREFMAHRQGDDRDRHLRRLHRRRRRRGRHRCRAAGVLRLARARRCIEGLMVVHNTLVGAGIRDRIKIGASGKMVTASAMARAMALGRRLVQLGAGVHVRGRLHPVAALPHQPVPGRRHDPGPQAAAGADRRRTRPSGSTTTTATPCTRWPR